jgi:small-conductance mechanosensitive channel
MTGRFILNRRTIRLTSLLITIAGVGARAAAQEPPPAPAPADTTPQRQLRPIPVDEIPAGAVTVADLLTRIRETLRGDTILNRLDSGLGQLERTVGVGREALTPDALQRASFDELVDVEQSWRGYQGEVSSLQRRLSERGTALESVAARLDTTRILWSLTRDSTPETELPVELRARVLEVLARIDSVDRQLRDPRTRVLGMRDRAAATLVTVRESIDLIRNARAEARRQVFRQDSPPFWRMFDVQPDSAAAASLSTTSFEGRMQAAGEYFRTHSWRLWLQLLVAAVIAAAVYALRHRASQWSAGQGASESLSLFDRPIASGLLIALALSRYFHPGAPASVYDVMLLLALLPLGVLLPAVLTREARKAGYLVIAITLTVLAFELLVTTMVVLRLAAVAVSLAGIVAFAWLLAARDVRGLAAQRGWWRSVRFGAWIGGAGLAASILANLLGYVNLAGILVTGMIYTAFAALAAATAAAVLDGILAVALTTGSSRSTLLHRQQGDLLRRGRRFIHLAVTILWLIGTLRIFRILEPAFDTARAIFGATLPIGSWTLSLGDVLVFVVGLWLAVVAARFTQAILREEVLSRMALPRGVPDSMSRLAYYAILVLGFLFAFGAAGLDLSKLTIIVGALGVGIGFGLQNIVNNFISGLILLFERPVQVGDTVELDTLMGSVKDIGIRASVIRTFSGADVIVPNGDLIAGRVVNWTLTDQRRRVEIPVGVAYGSEPQRVIDILTRVAGQHPDAVSPPEPTTHFIGFGESSLDFMIWVWTGRFDRWWLMRTEVLTTAYEALAEAGIEIPFPQRDLHLKTVQQAAARALAPQRASDDTA